MTYSNIKLPRIVGVAGGRASGKTVVSEFLQNAFGYQRIEMFNPYWLNDTWDNKLTVFDDVYNSTMAKKIADNGGLLIWIENEDPGRNLAPAMGQALKEIRQEGPIEQVKPFCDTVLRNRSDLFDLFSQLVLKLRTCVDEDSTLGEHCWGCNVVLNGVKVTNNQGEFHYLSCDEGWVYDRAKTERRTWREESCLSNETGPIKIELFEVEVDLDNVEYEEYFSAQFRPREYILRQLEQVSRRITDSQELMNKLEKELEAYPDA